MRRCYGNSSNLEANNDEIYVSDVYDNDDEDMVFPVKSKFIFFVFLLFFIPSLCFSIFVGVKYFLSLEDNPLRFIVSKVSIDENHNSQISDVILEKNDMNIQVIVDDVDDVETYSPVHFSSDVTYYVRNQLSEEHKALYDSLYLDLLNMQPTIIMKVDTSLVSDLFDFVLAEHPELYYINGYTYYEYANYVSVEPNYTMTRNHRAECQKQIDEQCNAWLAQIPIDADDYTKVKMLYEILIMNVDYNVNASDNQNIISVFLNKNTVCNGYASALVYMCQKLGIECTKLTGYGAGELHAWNLVKEDGNYYLVDVTWGNTLYNSVLSEKYVNYAYLNVTNKFLDKSHELISNFDVPVCFTIDNNYFYRENLLFDSVEESKNAFYNLTYDSIVSVRYADEQSYNDAIVELMSDGTIYECFDWNGNVDVRYFKDDDNFVLNVVRCDI